MAQTKLDLSDNKFEQLSTEVLHLSGCTRVFGQLQLESGSTLSILSNHGAGKVLTSDINGVGTWQVSTSGGSGIINASNGLTRIGTTDVILGGTLTGQTTIKGAPLKINVSTLNLTGNTAFNLTTGNGIITDTGNKGGLQYAACYDAYIVKLSIPNAGWVTGKTTISSNAYEIIYNNGTAIVGSPALKYYSDTNCALQLGCGSCATGNSSIAIGSAVAFGNCSLGMIGGTASGVYAVAISGQAFGDNSLAINGTAYCCFSIAINGISRSDFGTVIGSSGSILCSGNTNTVLLGGINLVIPENKFFDTVIVPSLAIICTPIGIGNVLCWNPTTCMIEQTIVGGSGIGWSNLVDGSTVAGCGTVASGLTICNNTFYGVCAGSCIGSGFSNVAIGYQASANNISGSHTIAIGSGALYQNKTGYNIGIGTSALCSNVAGTLNVGVGYYALRNNTSGCTNIAFGNYALQCNILGCRNVAIGHGAGYNETGSNKLYIANSCACSLIYGEFDTKMVKIDGCMCITSLPAKTTETCGVYIDALGKLSTGLISGSSSASLFEFTITGNSSATGFTVNHATGKQFVAVEVVRGSSPYDTIYTSVSRPNSNCVCIIFDTAPASGQQYKILITS